MKNHLVKLLPLNTRIPIYFIYSISPQSKKDGTLDLLNACILQCSLLHADNKLLHSCPWCIEQSRCGIVLSIHVDLTWVWVSRWQVGVVILNGYLALLLGIHRRKSGCHWSMLLSENTLLPRSHCRCAVLYFTALFSPCFENSSKSAVDQICAENTFFEKLPPFTDTCLIWTPLYYRQLDLSLQKKRPYTHFLKIWPS